MTPITDIIERVDEVLRQNKRTEWIYISLTTILFLSGIACFVKALASGNWGWSIPPAFTTGLLHWPLREIKGIRQKNIALATAPVLITLLPPKKAAEEIQKLLQNLYAENK